MTRLCSSCLCRIIASAVGAMPFARFLLLDLILECLNPLISELMKLVLWDIRGRENGYHLNDFRPAPGLDDRLGCEKSIS